MTHVAKSSTQNSSDVELNSMLIEAATDAQRVWRMQRIDVNALVALWRASLTIVVMLFFFFLQLLLKICFINNYLEWW